MNKVWEPYMRAALAEAQIAMDTTGDVPVGAVIVSESGEIVARGRNQKEQLADPTAHAEVMAIQEAAKLLGDWRLTGFTLVAWDDLVGASGSLYDLVRDKRLGSEIEVISGVLEAEASSQLKEFFAKKR
jgi:tRNA(adenine34) deaminase